MEKFYCPGCGLPIHLEENPTWAYSPKEYTCNSCYEKYEEYEQTQSTFNPLSPEEDTTESKQVNPTI